MSRRHRARGTAAAAATDGPAAAPAGRTRGAAPTPAPISPSADVPDWVGPPGSSVPDTRDSPALISNRELEASLCRAKCGRCDEPDCPGARDPAGKGDGCTGFSRERGDLAWLRGDHADARQPSAAQLAVLRRPAVSLVVAGKIEKISRGRRATAQQCTPRWPNLWPICHTAPIDVPWLTLCVRNCCRLSPTEAVHALSATRWRGKSSTASEGEAMDGASHRHGRN